MRSTLGSIELKVLFSASTPLVSSPLSGVARNFEVVCFYATAGILVCEDRWWSLARRAMARAADAVGFLAAVGSGSRFRRRLLLLRN